MILEKILVADDREENRKAAKEVFANADIVGSEAEAIQRINENEYDLVITDMQMEDKYSGLRVVKTALENGAIPYVLSHAGPSHQGVSVSMRPYGEDICNAKGKENPETWKEAKSRIESAEGVHKNYQEALLRAKSRRDKVELDDVIITAMYFTKEGN